MTRRDALLTLGAGAVLATARTNLGLLAAPQADPDFVKMYDDAQRERPARLASVTRIAPPGEPGIPLIVDARFFDTNGVTPLAGAVIFAYHTDREGLYRPRGEKDWWRLKAWARTDANGRVEFQTIRPAPYPGRNVAAHIHIYVDGPRGRRRALGLQFADDPLVTPADRAAAARAGRFSDLAVVETREGVQHCAMQFCLAGKNVF